MKNTNLFVLFAACYIGMMIIISLPAQAFPNLEFENTRVNGLDQLSEEALKHYNAFLSSIDREVGETFVVTDPGDESDEDLGDGIFFPQTFRSAIENANLDPDLDIIMFAESLSIIQLQNPLADLLATQPVLIDGTIGGIEKVIVDGTNGWQYGLWITGGNSWVKNMIIRNCTGGGLVVQGDNNQVFGCIIYNNNGPGINFNWATNCTIGGVNSFDRNVIYGNNGSSAYGLSLTYGSNNNLIEGNWIGTNNGMEGNGNEKDGILIDGTSNNLIINNLICDNDGGIYITGEQADGNIIRENLIGTDANGQSCIGNQDEEGIFIYEGSNTLIENNVLSCNFTGVSVMEGATNVVISGNLIGTDISGTTGLGNGKGILNRSDSILIVDNVISANTGTGIQQYIGSGGEIFGNLIGTDITGTQGLGNLEYGIWVVFASGVKIGDTNQLDGNLISGNLDAGIYLSNNSASGSMVINNHIGTDHNGENSIGNWTDGILISRGSSNNKILSNLISGNIENGIRITQGLGLIPQNNEIQGNFIGVDYTGESALGNLENGIYLDSCSNNLIGGNEFDQGNLISGNNHNGILISKSGAFGNTVQSNYIGTGVDSKQAIPNHMNGVSISNASDNMIGGIDEVHGNVISGNVLNGIYIVGSESTGNEVFGNKIGSDYSGMTKVGNDIGIAIMDARQNIIGSNLEGNGNLIFGNRIGIFVEGGDAAGNTFQGNDVISNEGGMLVQNSSGNVIGGTLAGDGNVIGYNSGYGLTIEGFGGVTSDDNLVYGNFIGVHRYDLSELPNENEGIYIFEGNGNRIGGSADGAPNVIAHNTGYGIVIDAGISNIIERNRIFLNDSLGIDLGYDGVTMNDENDPDTGPNGRQNFPEILNAYSATPGKTTIEGRLLSTMNSTFTLNFFYSDACDPSGYGEGEYFLGEAVVTTGSDGIIYFNQTFDHEVPDNKYITATATDEGDNTSEFCKCKAVGPIGITENPEGSLSYLTVHSVHPNPAIDHVWFDYTIKDKVMITLDIIDLAGNRVLRLIDNKTMAPGEHIYHWSSLVRPGSYIYRFSAGNQTLSGILHIID